MGEVAVEALEEVVLPEVASVAEVAAAGSSKKLVLHQGSEEGGSDAKCAVPEAFASPDLNL